MFSYHQWSWASKGCFHCKRAHKHHPGEGRKFPLQRCLPTLHLDSFFPEDTLFPQKPLRWMSWGWNCSMAHLCVSWAPPVQHFGHETVICPSGWRAAFSTCMSVCCFSTKTLTVRLRSEAVNCRIPPSQGISNSILVYWWVFLSLGCVTWKTISD